MITQQRQLCDQFASNPIRQSFWTRSFHDINMDIDVLHKQVPLGWFSEPESTSQAGSSSPGYWAVCRHGDIRTVSRMPEVYSSANGITITDMPQEFTNFFSSIIAMDNPRHARLRRIVSKGFTPKSLADIDNSVTRIAKDIVHNIAERGSCDFVVDIAAALPLKIVCDLMGIPEEYYNRVFANTNMILGSGDEEFLPPDVDPSTALLAAGNELADIMNEVAKTKCNGDGTDLTSILINAVKMDDQLSQADIASFFILLVIAGNETTRNAISWGLIYLTNNPDQRKIWSNDFEVVAPTAVEEIVRLASPVSYMRRTVTEDTILSGQKISEGEKVAMFYGIANRDPAVFDNPHSFNVLRDPNPQYGFGGPGPHYCLGAHLARREITVIYRELFSRLPDIVAVDEPDILQSSFIHGVKHLKAEFTPVTSF